MARQRSRASVEAARAARFLRADLAEWLLSALEGEKGDLEALADRVPKQLGFVPVRGLSWEELTARFRLD